MRKPGAARGVSLWEHRERAASPRVEPTTMRSDETPHNADPIEQRRRVGHTLGGAAVFAVACSLFLHALFSYMAANTRFGAHDSTGEPVEIRVELAEVVHETFEPSESEEFALTEPSVDPIPEPVIETSFDTDVPVPESELTSFSVSDLGELTSSSGADSSQFTSATLSAASASFFGVEARGSRFVYIVDTSGSMDSGRLVALKIALSDSISALPEQARFAVVRYSSTADSLGGSGWWKADQASKNEALRLVTALTAGGATEPVPAFRLAFGFTPAPDAIYFMTDGKDFSNELENDIVGSVKRFMRQTSTRPTIHTISFVDKDSESLMRRIARMTGGSYTHVPGLGP